MATKWTKAPSVEVGKRITSTQARGLARAVNDRLRTIQDLPWRISWFWHSLWRQPRNPDESGFAFPSQGEFWEIFGGIDPDFTNTQWPEAAPGEPEGANLANPMMGFVFGYAGGPDDEPSRMTIPMSRPGTLRGLWDLGRDQRGGYDPTSQGQNAPAFDAAVTLFSQRFGKTNFWHKGYGGLHAQPTPVLDNCGSTSVSGAGIPSYEILFTATRADAPTDGLHGAIGSSGGNPTVTYPGTCPCGTDEHTAGHVLGVVEHPLYWIVYASQGDADCTPDVDYLPRRDWISGPYEATPRLEHTEGDQLFRAAWQFVTDFRGSTDQRSDPNYRVEKVAWDSQAFFTSQYPLAPARARLEGDFLAVDYPSATIRGVAGFADVGTAAQWQDGSRQYATAPNFVLGGIFLSASGLRKPVAVSLFDGDVKFGAISLTPDADGNAEALRWFPDAKGTVALRLVLASPADFSPGGEIRAEIAEIVAWRPFYWDAYLCLRNVGTRGGGIESNGVDGRGMEFAGGPKATADLLKFGCLLNPDGLAPRSQPDWVSDNPLYDAARRLSRSHVRIAHRRQLVGYERTGGKSVLYFKRFAFGLSGQKVDLFDGIAPPWERVPLGKIQNGERYLVRGTSGSVLYGGQSFAPGAKFSGGPNPNFASYGDCEVFVAEGIRASAPPGGRSNQWLGFLETKCYHPSESSIWKPAAYSDYFTFNSRCLFYAGAEDLQKFAQLREMVAINYGVSLDPDTQAPVSGPLWIGTLLTIPEAPSAFIYWGGTDNVAAADDDFCTSCRIYEKPYEIESCTVHDWGADQVIKITLDRELRKHPDAPATVSLSVGAWSSPEVANLRGESYRTDDNAMREYVRHQWDPGYQCTFKTGDAGAGSFVSMIPDNPLGSCYPTWHFVRLVDEPFEDQNDTEESTDSRCLSDLLFQVETYTRIICEAFVDAQTSGELVCKIDDGNLYEFTFPNLCFQAFGGSWIGAFSAVARPDGEPGFAALPNVLAYAEPFNRLSACLNLLTKLRLDLPIIASAREYTGSASRSVVLGPPPQFCNPSGDIAGYIDGQTPEDSDADTVSSWNPTTGWISKQAAGLTGCPFELTTERVDVEWKVEIATQFDQALPDHIREMVDEGRIGLMAKVITTIRSERRKVVPEAESAGCCRAEDEPCPGHWTDGAGTFYGWEVDETIETVCRTILPSRITAPKAPKGDFRLGRDVPMNPGVYCANGTLGEIAVSLYETTPFIEFELE